MSRYDQVWSGFARQARYGEVWLGMARHGQVLGGTASPDLTMAMACPSMAGYGQVCMAWYAQVWLGMARYGRYGQLRGNLLFGTFGNFGCACSWEPGNFGNVDPTILLWLKTPTSCCWGDMPTEYFQQQQPQEKINKSLSE